ncbi:MAG: hypothetical protein ACHQJ6_07135 [Candidatus Berkiellales bacterium]
MSLDQISKGAKLLPYQNDAKYWEELIEKHFPHIRRHHSKPDKPLVNPQGLFSKHLGNTYGISVIQWYELTRGDFSCVEGLEKPFQENLYALALSAGCKEARQKLEPRDLSNIIHNGIKHGAHQLVKYALDALERFPTPNFDRTLDFAIKMAIDKDFVEIFDQLLEYSSKKDKDKHLSTLRAAFSHAISPHKERVPVEVNYKPNDRAVALIAEDRLLDHEALMTMLTSALQCGPYYDKAEQLRHSVLVVDLINKCEESALSTASGEISIETKKGIFLQAAKQGFYEIFDCLETNYPGLVNEELITRCWEAASLHDRKNIIRYIEEHHGKQMAKVKAEVKAEAEVKDEVKAKVKPTTAIDHESKISKSESDPMSGGEPMSEGDPMSGGGPMSEGDPMSLDEPRSPLITFSYDQQLAFQGEQTKEHKEPDERKKHKERKGQFDKV